MNDIKITILRSAVVLGIAVLVAYTVLRCRVCRAHHGFKCYVTGVAR